MKYLLPVFLLFVTLSLGAQKLFPVKPLQHETLPAWALEMYGPEPNVWRVDDGYRSWRRQHPEVKTTFTQYYKKWRRAAAPHIDERGYIRPPAVIPAEESVAQERAASWKCIGPFETFNTNKGPAPLPQSSQVNVYCFDQSPANPDVLYCGTEGGEIFKSTDRGENWVCISRNLVITAPTAIETHPLLPETVIAGEGNNLRRSTDGGQNWTTVLTVNDLSPNEIKYNPANPQVVLAACAKGLYRSTDGGDTWTLIEQQAAYDIEWKTDDANTAFLVRHDEVDGICRFYKSADMGLTWSMRTDGWFFSSDPARNDGGARLAVTNADPDRLYAVLIGEGKSGDDGFIGIYRSDDGGETWSLPNAPAGGPYNETDHPNLATIGLTGGYHQGFYNLGLDVSDEDPDFLLAGFLKLWRSTDGGASFECIGGYCNNDFNYVHPDCQEIEINGPDVWMMSDGGIERSTDFFQTHYAKNRGITSSDFWGFSTGWNEDVLAGGRYHNGNTGWAEGFAEGEHQALGGGEAPTGYVNPGEPRTAYFSDIGGVQLPAFQNGYTRYFGFGKYPNESYYDAESGEMEWDPRSWNTLMVTHENKLWYSSDGGQIWEVLHAFGTDPLARAMQFEISRSNPAVMYLFQRAAYSWDPGTLWKTTDGGASWNTIPLPPGYARRMVMTLDPLDENRLWIAYADGANGQKIYRTTDGGLSWQNRTTAALNNQSITYLLHQGGTQGGVYVGTYRSVFYRNDNMQDWVNYADGLPASISTCILRPFYRDGKLRLGAYGKGIWEAPWYEPSVPVAQPMVNKRITNCPGDTLQFDDYSMLLHDGASWQWEFPGGTPTISTLRNPRVVYTQPGVYDVKLTVTNAFGSHTKTVNGMVEVQTPVVNSLPVSTDFSQGPAPLEILNPDGGVTWEPLVLTTCDSDQDTVYWVHNYVYSAYGRDELLLPVNLDLTGMQSANLTFDVAYAPYYDGNAFIDSLFVEISADCGATTRSLLRTGGEALSTTTSGQGPNNLYEYEEFQPASCDEWRTIVLDLQEYLGRYITVRIVSQSGYGNNLYIDDIALGGDPLVTVNDPDRVLPTLAVWPNPAREYTRLRGAAPQGGTGVLEVLDAAGRTVWQRSVELPAGSWELPLPVAELPPGMYWVKMSGGAAVWPVVRYVVMRG